MRSVIVIPVLNEEKNILGVLEKTRKVVRHDERIVVVDNGSTDRTAAIVRENFPEIELVTESERGKGNAVRKGFDKALGHGPEYVIMMDGDGERNPEDIRGLLEFAEKSGADMVVGRRDVMRSGTRDFLRRFENWWLRLATGYDIRDGSSGFNVIGKEAVRKFDLRTGNFEIEPEIILESRRNKLKVFEHPVSVPEITPTKVRKSHIRDVNKFFDQWVLEWIGSGECDLPWHKKSFLRVFCSLGLRIF